MKNIAHLLSAIFSPLLMGTWAITLVMWLSFLSLTPMKTQLFVILATFVATCIIPVIAIWLLNRFGHLKDPMLTRREDRMLPYIIATICYIGTALYYFNINAPQWLTMFMFGGALTLIVLTVVNRWWKISGHAAGVGGLVALMYFLMASDNCPQPITWQFMATLLFAGAVCTSRLILDKHTPWQVAAGFATGVICVMLPEWLL